VKRVIKIMMLALILVSGLAVVGCSSSPVSEQIPAPGRPAPDFQLQSLDGQTFSLKGLRGSPIMLNFWATWCGPCRLEIPFIQEIYEDKEFSEQGLVILAINLGESPAQVKQFVADNGLSFTVLLDTNLDVAKMYNASRIPLTYFVDKNGIIKDMEVGAFVKKADLEWRLINSIINVE
jgi:cytochrome c biogenesis protein CcmG/thiol:disulfide interchange protein DsbE